MDFSLCHIKKIKKNDSSTRPRIYIVVLLYKSLTRLIQISLVEVYRVYGEAGGAIVLFVCILSLYNWIKKRRNKIVIHLIELTNRKRYYRYDIRV